ncbi:ABC transporter substrate-binding protein [Paenibacillus periandrae]|uniref:ABC transporter substrate-binding protein n=1 Tax=Paenibacillus periandrae TaxID=1761741 RepID=UPI001F0970B8|nr:ABC transporter substrate-binding protein [Paenibacillus periandrae]
MKTIYKSMLIAGATALLLTACEPANPQLSKTDGNATVSGGDSKPAVTEKTTDLNLVILYGGNEVKDLQLVQDEVNKLTKSTINVTIKMTLVSAGDFVQKTNLMLTGNEKVDLVVVSPFFGYTNQVARGQLQPLDKLLDQYGPDIKKVLDPAYLNASKINGSIYGVPGVKDFAAGFGIVMRKDLVDKYQIDTSKIKTLEDMGSALKMIKDNEPNVTPMIHGSIGINMFALYKWFDELGDGNGVLPGYDNNLKVVDLYETPEYAEKVKLMRDWYTSGYILKDIATTKEDHMELFKTGKAFSYLTPTKPGVGEQASKYSGLPVVIAEVAPPVITTASVTSFMWGIPRNSMAPDKAMQFLNLMYKDKDLVNLLDWGIEGKDYVKKSDNIIDFPPGITAASNPYALNMNYLFGNQYLGYIFNGNDPELWKKMEEFNKSAQKSKALGFNFDGTPVKTEIAAVNNVVNSYRAGLEAGVLDPAKKLSEFISKLKDAGIDKIIAEKQKQLDEWAKTNK